MDLLAAAVALTGAAMFVPASPASALTVCVGLGQATVGAGLGLPGIHPARHADVTVNFNNLGNCPGLEASGMVWGHCGSATGTGTTNTIGHHFSLVIVGTQLVLTGAVTATVNVAEDPLDSGSCTTGTATNFILAGIVVLNL